MANAALGRRRAAVSRVPAWRRLGLSLLGLAAAAGLAYGGVTLVADPRFALGVVGVRGAARTPADAIVGAAALRPGHNIWLLNTPQAERRVKGLPWVASARVARGWPNHVAIVVTERAPAARLALDAGGYALVDADGRVLGDASAAKDQALPALSIKPVPADAGVAGTELGQTTVGQALDAMRRLTSLGVHVTEIHSEPVMGFSARTQTDVRVVFGDLDDLAEKVALFDAIAKHIVRPADVEFVDVRSTAAPTVQYRR